MHDLHACIHLFFYAERSIEASHNVEIAIASSVSTFVVASLLFYAIGFLCGCFCKERKRAESASPAEQTQTPYYDEVVLQQHEQQELELQNNIAYTPVSL